MPSQITRFNELRRNGKIIKGRWQLDPRHQLVYHSQNRLPEENKSSEKFELETTLVAAEENVSI